MDNQTKPESSGSMMISTSELRRRAVPKNVLVKSLLSRTPNVPPNEIALEAQNRSAVKVEPSDKIVLQVQNQSEMNIESKSRRYKDRAKRTPRHNSNHEAPYAPLDEIDLGAQNRSEVKVEPKWGRYKDRVVGFCNSKFQPTCCFRSLQKRKNRFDYWERDDGWAVAGRPLGCGSNEIDLKDKIDLEAQNQSEVKVELPEKIALQVQNQSEVKVEPKSRRYKHSASWPPRHILDHEVVFHAQNQSKVKAELQENTALQVENQCEVKVKSKLWLYVQDQIKKKTTEWAFLITSVLLEVISVVFDQMGQALMGMVIAFLALFLSSLDLICKAREEVKRSPPSCLYPGSSQPFGGLLEYYGLAAAVWQCFNSTMGYIYTRKNQQNPIKMCLLPFMFASCVLIFSLIKRRT